MTRWIGTAVLLVAFSVFANAQPPRRGNQGGGPRDNAAPSFGPRPLNPIMNALDTNHDRSLSADEIQSAPTVLLSLDKDNDGVLNPTELSSLFNASGNASRVAGKHERPSDQPAEKIAQAMSNTVQNFVPIEKSRRELASLGLKSGISYETGIPVSGKGEANDRERYQQQLLRLKRN